MTKITPKSVNSSKKKEKRLRKFIKKADLFPEKQVRTSPGYDQIKKGHYLGLKTVPLHAALWVSKVTPEYIATWDRRGNLTRITPEVFEMAVTNTDHPLQIIGYRKWDITELVQVLDEVSVSLPGGKVKLTKETAAEFIPTQQ